MLNRMFLASSWPPPSANRSRCLLYVPLGTLLLVSQPSGALPATTRRVQPAGWVRLATTHTAQHDTAQHQTQPACMSPGDTGCPASGPGKPQMNRRLGNWRRVHTHTPFCQQPPAEGWHTPPNTPAVAATAPDQWPSAPRPQPHLTQKHNAGESPKQTREKMGGGSSVVTGAMVPPVQGPGGESPGRRHHTLPGTPATPARTASAAVSKCTALAAASPLYIVQAPSTTTTSSSSSSRAGAHCLVAGPCHCCCWDHAACRRRRLPQRKGWCARCTPNRITQHMRSHATTMPGSTG
jgi:hypothetical protein